MHTIEDIKVILGLQLLSIKSKIFKSIMAKYKLVSLLVLLFFIKKGFADNYYLELTNNRVSENQPKGTLVGVLKVKPQQAETYTFELQMGVGDTDNNLFVLYNDSLFTDTSFNYESRQVYNIRILAKESISTVYIEEQLEVFVVNIPEQSTSLNLSNNSIRERSPIETFIGVLSDEDVDLEDIYSYELYNSSEYVDNAYFKIENDTLYSNWKFHQADKDTYTISVRSEDSGGNAIHKSFDITISERNYPPTNISISSDTISEYQPIGTLVGVLSAEDNDIDDTHSYTIVHSTQGNAFQLRADSLFLNTDLNFSEKSLYDLIIKVTDGKEDGSYEQMLRINIVEAPPVIISPHDTTICKEKSIQLFAIGDVDYTWMLPDGQEFDMGSEVEITPEESIRIIVHGHRYGTDTATVTVSEDPSCFDFKVFEFVTPNDDGKNDYFEIFNQEYFAPVTVSIYDRQGGIIFSTEDYKNDWDGADLPEGSYAYKVEVPVLDKVQTGFLEIRRNK